MQMFDNGEFALEITTTGSSFRVAALGLARALGSRDGYTLVRNLPSAEKGHVLERADTGDRQEWFVTEPGFYRVLGQRQASRIKNPDVRASVERFQDWVYGTVLPAIRRTGGYVSDRSDYSGQQPRNSMETRFEPNAYTWDELAALIHQRTGIPLTVNELTRMLRAAGVLKQTGAPTAKFRHLFWFTGSSWNVHSHVVPQITYKVFETGRELQDFRFIQARLELEGVGQAATLPAQRQSGIWTDH